MTDVGNRSDDAAAPLQFDLDTAQDRRSGNQMLEDVI
jgi:hypothetical protein